MLRVKLRVIHRSEVDTTLGGARVEMPRGDGDDDVSLVWAVRGAAIDSGALSSSTLSKRLSRDGVAPIGPTTWTHGDAPREPRQRPTRLITRDFCVPRPPRRPDFGRSDSVAYEFVQFGRGNREPETFRGARSLDARRDNPARPPRASATHSATPLRWPTPRALDARNLLSQNAVRTPQNANAPAGRPGRSLLTVGRASFARAS